MMDGRRQTLVDLGQVFQPVPRSPSTAHRPRSTVSPTISPEHGKIGAPIYLSGGTMATEREKEIRRRRHRRAKLRRLKAKLAATRSKEERQKIIAKIRKIHPFLPLPER